jgi:4a-hydroxytetrahydrobiopterin dehydratase
MTGRITARQFHQAAGVGDWRVLGEGACAYFRTGSFEAGVRLVQAIAEWAASTTTLPMSTYGTRA